MSLKSGSKIPCVLVNEILYLSSRICNEEPIWIMQTKNNKLYNKINMYNYNNKQINKMLENKCKNGNQIIINKYEVIGVNNGIPILKINKLNLLQVII